MSRARMGGAWVGAWMWCGGCASPGTSTSVDPPIGTAAVSPPVAESPCPNVQVAPVAAGVDITLSWGDGVARDTGVGVAVIVWVLNLTPRDAEATCSTGGQFHQSSVVGGDAISTRQNWAVVPANLLPDGGATWVLVENGGLASLLLEPAADHAATRVELTDVAWVTE